MKTRHKYVSEQGIEFIFEVCHETKRVFLVHDNGLVRFSGGSYDRACKLPSIDMPDTSKPLPEMNVPEAIIDDLERSESLLPGDDGAAPLLPLDMAACTEMSKQRAKTKTKPKP